MKPRCEAVGCLRHRHDSKGKLTDLKEQASNYYGTPKPPAEPSPVQPDLVDQVLFDEEFDTEVQRKRTTSVSKMDRKDSVAPEEEEEEERPPMVNGLAEGDRVERQQQRRGAMRGAPRSSNGATFSPPVSFSFYHLPLLYCHPIPLSVSMPASLSPCRLTEHQDKAEWRKTVPSYNQSAAAMDLRVWNPQDDGQEALPKKWETAYTETGMVYFIE
ncbi:Membrane-associated guanylate kinase, WW and PDZ domain-containing protein 3 [Liparis tanakae]|uniref:Membrane-associated guanylate kinase, WW and PDZ domain-containing protein 3 n=1 Tax=Liparis tanakae TaxID=230148 RepID=A0A4Z2FBZ6_9TELE|nr:Membrane-associated guanylate kinase, WW and PDZ domain-containing protein 3 [Liparis tanakae]